MPDHGTDNELSSVRRSGGAFSILDYALGGMYLRARRAGVVVLAALACLLLPGSLLATDWNLSATFEDDGSLTGTFALNNGTVSNWNIVASTGSSMPAFTFTPSNSTAAYSPNGLSECTGPCLQFISNQQFGDSVTYQLNLNLSFQGPLTEGTVDMYVTNSS